MSRLSWWIDVVDGYAWPAFSSELVALELTPVPARLGRFGGDGAELVDDTGPVGPLLLLCRFWCDSASWSFLFSVLVRRRSDSFWALKVKVKK